MNAVKRCQALIAATLLIGIGACSGDPTAKQAGKDLSIRATPGAVWVRNNSAATVNIEAVDGLGGPVEGSWAVGTIVGPFTAALDTTFQNTTAGALDVKARFVVTPTAEGEGSVDFTGTGGTVTVPVRVAPDTSAFNVVFSTLTPAIAQTITATAPAGTRFTNGTTIAFYNGPLPLDLSNGLAAPSLVGYNADSTVMTILPAPGANGQIRFTGIASVSTPGLTSTARSTQSVTVPTLASAPAVFSNAAPALNASVTVTLGANFKFRPTSVLSSNGMKEYVISRTADSTAVTFFPTQGTNGPVAITLVQFAPLASLSLGLPTSASIVVPAATKMGADDFFGSGGIAALGQMTANGTLNTPKAYFDIFTYTAPDNVGDGGPGEQDYSLTFPVAGTYKIELSWDSGADVDLSLLDNAYNAYYGGSYKAAGLDELFNYTAGAGQQTVLAISQFAGTAPGHIRVVITRTS